MNKVRPVLRPCRVCGALAAREIGCVEFYEGYAWPILDCGACGCRSTQHDASVYDRLHTEGASCYQRYRHLQTDTKSAFDRGDGPGLKALLCQTNKYKLVIDQIDTLPLEARLLEIGCARGFLTCYSILAGRPILGVDISPEAIDSARAAYGDHFVTPDSPRVQSGAPYDFIYHIGTIGCVADPVGMTRNLLGMLKPGGRLMFNAPNRQACSYRKQLWFNSAPPPDVVTLFPPGFWARTCGDLAEIREDEETCAPETNQLVWLRKLRGWKWREPAPLPLKESVQPSQPEPNRGDCASLFVERVLNKVGQITQLNRLVPPQPTEYGLFVTMTRK